MVFLLSAVLLQTCSDEGGDGGNESSGPASLPTSGPAQSPEAEQTISGNVGGGLIEARVQPLVRSGDLVVLTVDVEGSGADVALGSVFADASRIGETGVTELRLVDAERGVVHTVAEDAEGRCVCSHGLLETGSGTTTVQAAFGAPPAEVEALAVMLPHLGVVPDVPVVEGTIPTTTDAATESTTAATGLDPASVENAPVTALETYSEQLAGQVRTRADAQTVTVSIDTDVLFAFDSADLSPEAETALGAAAGQILESGAGTLSITGHTDDSGSDAYNLELSERRAQAVAQALAGRLPADRYPTTVAGRGETEPAVPNTSEEGRALNRRVELVLTTAGEADAVSASPTAAASLPPPPAVGRGVDGVEVRAEPGPESFRIAAPQARRSGTALVVDLQVAPVSGDGGVIGSLLSTGAVGSRGQFDPWNQFASNGVRLLSGAEATYPLEYVIGTEPDGVPQRTCLCERWLNQDSPVGVTTTATVWLPDPGPDASTVTLDVEGLLRLTDVPVR